MVAWRRAYWREALLLTLSSDGALKPMGGWENAPLEQARVKTNGESEYSLTITRFRDAAPV